MDPGDGFADRASPSRLSVVGRFCDRVPSIFVFVKLSEADPEQDATNESKDGNDTVVPDEQWIGGQRGKSLPHRRRKGRHEEIDRHDQTSHVRRSFRKSVLVGGNIGEDLGDANQDVWKHLDPHIDRSRTILSNAVGIAGVGAARCKLVYVELSDTGGNHGESAEEETNAHTLDGSEVEAYLSEARVDDVVHDGDHDDNRDRIQILNQIVGNTM